MSNESKFRVSPAQTNILCTFFENNPGLIRGYRKTIRNKGIVQRKWKKVTDKLNSCGPSRSQKSWATYLSNIKAKLKGHSLIWRKSADGSSPVVCNANKYNEIQLRMLKVLSKRPNFVETDQLEYQNQSSSPLLTQRASQMSHQALQAPSPTKSDSISSSDDSDSGNDLIILDPYEQHTETEQADSTENVNLEESGHSSQNYGNVGNAGCSSSTGYPAIRTNTMSRELKYRVTVPQTKILIEFFEKNPEVIKGYKRTKDSKIRVQNKWKKIAVKLNAYGPSRDPLSWSKYLSNMKAKLKGHKIKWSQSSNGTGPIMCNADDFNEIQLKMMQILSKGKVDSRENENSQSDSEGGDGNENEINTDNDDGMFNNNRQTTEPGNNLPNTVKSERNASKKLAEVFVDDEFTSFGKNVAQQLRNLPLPVALETQEKLLSVLRDQRIKFLIGSTRNLDPLDK
ncbi:unnamed protein product [Chrysodeixis includens]|uniref:Regulatory protein zeste n=1 Tax=Chrysodeixis includens TaxID=689277 RepID=A0A9N8PYJ7_CHRIL|nr:unnamed protein product [Chrysodeixis includens]